MEEVEGMTFHKVLGVGTMAPEERDGPMPAPDMVDQKFKELEVAEFGSW